MSRYGDRRSTAVLWAGSLPTSWAERRTKFLYQRERRVPSENAGVVTAFRDGEVTLRDKRRADGFTFAEKEIGYQGVRIGDLVVHSMDGFAGAIGVSDSDGKCSPVYLVCTPCQDLEPRFHAYVLRHMAISGYIASLAKGIRERSTSFGWSELADQVLPSPAPEIQRAIADFLDYKTAAIDALLQKKERLLALLAEKRGALIHNLVTNAAGPSVKLAYLVDLLSGYAFASSRYSTNPDDVRLLRGVNVAPDAVRWDDVVRWPVGEVNGLRKWLLRPGDTVIGLDRPWISAGFRIATLSDDDCPSLLLQRVARIRCGKLIIPEYLRLQLISEPFKAFVEPDMTGVSVPHISPEQVLSYRVRLPSVAQQVSVCEHLQSWESRAAPLEVKLRASIDRLREYRQALITSAVTGQLDIGGSSP